MCIRDRRDEALESTAKDLPTVFQEMGLVRAVMELEERFSDDGLLPVRAGIASGLVILFEGDDYTGGPVNLASRLCDLAQPFEVLTTAEVAENLPEGVAALPVGNKPVPGFAAPVPVVRITCMHADDPAADALASDS